MTQFYFTNALILNPFDFFLQFTCHKLHFQWPLIGKIVFDGNGDFIGEYDINQYTHDRGHIKIGIYDIQADKLILDQSQLTWNYKASYHTAKTFQ